MRLLLYICTSLLTVPVLAITPDLHILVDAGHGGADHGAEREGIREKDISLSVALQLREKLRATAGLRTSMTREDDTALNLEQRGEIVQAVKPDLIVSIHINSSDDSRAQGMELYFQNQLPADEESLLLAARENQTTTVGATGRSAESISSQSDLNKILEDLDHNRSVRRSRDLCEFFINEWLESGGRRTSRAIRQAPFFMVSQTTIPAVLVELGFLSHHRESTKLKSPEYQAQLVENLYRGLLKYKDLVDKDRPPVLKSAHAN